MTKPTRVRFKVLAFCVLLASVTYLDRVCISITAPLMMRDLNLSQMQMGFVFSAFTVAYALFEIPTGYWGDRIGSRRVLTRIVVWWSAFTMATAAAFNYTSLLVTRFLFGAGEAGAWPNAALTFSRWFPSSERGRAQGIFFMGAHLAGGITPLLVAGMLTVMSWRMVFVVFGLVGLLWAAAWFWWYRDDPAEHPSANDSERELIHKGRRLEGRHSLTWSDFTGIFANRNMLLLCAMYFTQSYGFYFFITWLPTYLKERRGLDAVQLGILAGLPLLLSVLADLLGGISTDYAVRRYGLRWGRAGVGIISFTGAAAFMLIGTGLRDAVTAAVFIAIAGAFSNFTLGASWGACVDIGGRQAGVVSACMNTSGQVGGTLSPIIVAFVLSRFATWEAPLYLTGCLYAIGALCWIFIDATKPIWREEPEPVAALR